MSRAVPYPSKVSQSLPTLPGLSWELNQPKGKGRGLNVWREQDPKETEHCNNHISGTVGFIFPMVVWTRYQSMLAAGNSPSITKWPMSECYLPHFGIKHIEPEMEVGRPFIVVRTGGKLNYTSLTWSLNAFLLPPLFGTDSFGGYKGMLQRESGKTWRQEPGPKHIPTPPAPPCHPPLWNNNSLSLGPPPESIRSI